MTLPTNVIINIVFVAFYAVILGPVVFNVIKHSKGRQGFVFLLIFCLVRLVGNALLIDAYNNDYSSKDELEGGLILQGLGYAFLLSAALGLYMRATTDPLSNDSGARSGLDAVRMLLDRGGSNSGEGSPSTKSKIATGLNLLNTVALILLIVGYVKSNGLFSEPPDPNAMLNATAKVGDILFVILTVILGAMTVGSILGQDRQTHQTRPILFTLIAALPLMLLRAVFVTYQAFQRDPFGEHLVLRAVLQYAVEALVELIFTAMGLYLLLHRGTQHDVEQSAPGYTEGGFTSGQHQLGEK